MGGASARARLRCARRRAACCARRLGTGGALTLATRFHPAPRRALQAHTAALYALVWAAAAAGSPVGGPPHGAAGLDGAPSGAGAGAGARAAARVVVGMVRAASELRQLDATLSQLVSAAAGRCLADANLPPGSQEGGTAGGTACGAAAAGVLGDAEVLAGIEAAVADAPPGERRAALG